MMSPRSSGRYGRSFSFHAPRPPKINLFTRRWSPTSRVLSIEAEGILNACTINVVPNSARMTVTSRDSRYSESVVWSPRGSGFFGDSGIAASGMAGCWVAISSIVSSASCLGLFQPLESGARRALLRFLLGAAFRGRQAFAIGPDFNSKRLLVIRPAFSGEPVLRGRLSAALQEFLQGGFLVAVPKALAAFYQCVFEQRGAQHFARRRQSRIQINCGDDRFKCVRQQGRFLAASGLLLAAAEP